MFSQTNRENVRDIDIYHSFLMHPSNNLYLLSFWHWSYHYSVLWSDCFLSSLIRTQKITTSSWESWDSYFSPLKSKDNRLLAVPLFVFTIVYNQRKVNTYIFLGLIREFLISISYQYINVYFRTVIINNLFLPIDFYDIIQTWNSRIR